ncbi:hypothetical protein ACA910_020561 [Epithemia clementina (nom. ined.)]
MKITVVDDNDATVAKRLVASEKGFQEFLNELNVSCLLTLDGFKIKRYDEIEVAGEGQYKRGDEIEEPVVVLPTIDLELCLRTKKPVKVSLSEEEQTMDHLEQLTRDRFDIPLARLAFTLPNDVPLNNDSKLHAIPPDKPTKLAVSVTRVDFSSISTVKDALKLLGQTGDRIPIDDNAFPKPKQIEDGDGELLHAVSTLQRLHDIVPLPQGCEVTRRLYIDPFLLASARLAGEILIQVEKVYESKDVWGPVDYVFKFGDQTICVTEGKKDNIDGGVIQNVAQLSAVSDDRKRKFSEISAKEGEEKPIYGIATTYLNWSFLVLNKGVVTQSSIYGIKDGDMNDVGGIIGRIVAILEEGKKS